MPVTGWLRTTPSGSTVRSRSSTTRFTAAPSTGGDGATAARWSLGGPDDVLAVLEAVADELEGRATRTSATERVSSATG